MKRKLLVMTTVMVLVSSALLGCGSTDSDNEPVTESALESTDVKVEAELDSDVTQGDGSDIYKEYHDIVSGIDTKEWDGFALIDLDGDGVKELFATCIDGEREDPGIQPYMIIGYKADGTAVKNEELQDGVAGAGGYRGNLYYLEGKGILHESMVFAPFGIPADSIYTIKDGLVETTDMGEFVLDIENIPEEDDDWDPLETGSWTWNGETVTEEEYYNNVREATGDTEGLPMSEIAWKSKDEILKVLEK